MAFLLSLFSAPLTHAGPSAAAFNFSECLFEEPSAIGRTLGAKVVSINCESGDVECNGGDSAQPKQPFLWDWGDRKTSKGFFPQTHRYKALDRNYVIKVTAFYPGSRSDTVDVGVSFVPQSLLPDRPSLPEGVRVIIPTERPPLSSARAPYAVPPNLTGFDDVFFHTCTRQTVEYVLTQAATIQLDFVSNDVCKENDRFEQVVLRDSTFRGMYSLWYTDPVCFGVGDYGFKGRIEWSSFFHEMGHNVTLNSPAKFHWGFKQDGPANCIFSETMAQIFQHATAYELVNDARKYGISSEISDDIARSAQGSMRLVRRCFDDYLKNGRRYCSWNNTETKQDETSETVMTMAYKFFEHAEKDGHGYRQPVKRLMTFLNRFNSEWEKQFSARSNNPKAEQFRATLMVAAFSHSFAKDLREEFRALGFPIDDKTFVELKVLD